MPERKAVPARVKLAIPKLLDRGLRVGGAPGIKEKRPPLIVPAMMIIESANRFLTDRRSFGAQKESLDRAVAPFFRLAFSSQARAQAFRAGYEAYGKLADSISTKAKVKGKKLRTFCAKDVAQYALQSMLNALTAKEEHLEALGVEVVGTITVESGAIESDRTVTASIDLIECKDPEEQQVPDKVKVCVDLGPFGEYCTTVYNPLYGENSGDEIYVTSFGAIFSSDGYKVRRSLVSEVFTNIGTVPGHVSSFPPGVARLPLQDVLRVAVLPRRDTKAYYAYYSFTVFEHEYSDEERREALAQAALDATEAVIALLQQNWIGFGVNIAQFLYDLAVALDDDDCLGSAAFRYDDVGRLPSLSVGNPAAFDDTHWLNHYRYDVQSRFAIEAA